MTSTPSWRGSRALQLAAAAGAAGMLALAAGPAAGAEVYRVDGVWAAGPGGATVFVGTGWLEPPHAYIVKWSSPQPLGEDSYWIYDFELEQHYETYDGEVLFHQVGGDTVWPLDVAPGVRSTFMLAEPYIHWTYGADYFGYDRWREAYSFRARAGAEAVGKPFTFLVTTVPEPSSWALIILGFLGAGAALRRRRAGQPCHMTSRS